MSSPRVLMIAHGFPPATGSGSLRALAFARYLPMYGWRPVVLTPDLAWAAHRDDDLLREVPQGLELVRTASFEPRPGGTAKASMPHGKPRSVSKLRAHLGHARRFPDAHVGWLPHAVAAGVRLQADVLYSSSGPFTSHVVGLALHRLTGKPWVAELRDGWYRWNRAIFPDYPRWRDALECKLEAAVIRSATRVVLVTERMAWAFREQYRDLPEQRFAVVSNGFDPLQHARTQAAQRGFHVVHAGALYYGRSLAAFLAAAARVVNESQEFAHALGLTLLGTLDTQAQTELARHGLGQPVEVLGQRPHATALEAMRNADVLLLISNTTTGAEATVPGKLFEYLAASRPVLAVAPPDSATADVLAQTRVGWLAPAHDVEAIAQTLKTAFEAVSTSRLPPRDERAIMRFDRRLLAGELASILDAARRL